jgi:hypothetical protein
MEGARRMDEESQPIRIPKPDAIAPPSAPEPQADDGDAIEEWEAEQHTPLVVAAKLAELVRKTARATMPPINQRAEPEPSIVVSDELAPAPPPVAKPPARTPAVPIPVIKMPAPVATVPVPVPVPDPVAKPAPTPAPVPVPVPPPPRAETATTSRRPTTWWIAAALLVAGAGTAIPFVTGTPATPAGRDPLPQLQADADKLASAIDTATGAAKLRAKNLATTPLLRAGIETDAATVQDLAKSEQLFVPVNGETIEVFQLRDGAPSSMLRIPATSPALKPSLEESTRLSTDGRTLAVIASSPIAKQGSGVGGVLAVATPCDLAAIVRGLADHAVQATLIGLDKPVVLVTGTGTGKTLTLPLAKGSSLSLAAVVTSTAVVGSDAMLVNARYALWGAGGVLLLLYVVLTLRARKESASR